MYGTITINGKTYVEREETIPFEFDVTSNGQISPSVTLALPGIANFRLKSLTRATVQSHAVVTTCPFKFRLGNSDGSVWYSDGGSNAKLGTNSPTGGSTDAVLDSLMFGNGQFPYALPVPLYYSANASIRMYIEDVSNNATYTIYFGFHGAFLLEQ